MGVVTYGITLGGSEPSSTTTFLANQHLLREGVQALDCMEKSKQPDPCKRGTGSNVVLIEHQI
jgi:hypothetical protein